MFWAEHTLFSTDGLVWSRPLVFFGAFFNLHLTSSRPPTLVNRALSWFDCRLFRFPTVTSALKTETVLECRAAAVRNIKSYRGHDGGPFKVSWVWFSWVQLFFFVSKREQVSALQSTQRCPGQCFFSERSRTALSQHKMQISSSRSATNLAD